MHILSSISLFIYMLSSALSPRGKMMLLSWASLIEPQHLAGAPHSCVTHSERSLNRELPRRLLDTDHWWLA